MYLKFNATSTIKPNEMKRRAISQYINNHKNKNLR